MSKMSLNMVDPNIWYKLNPDYLPEDQDMVLDFDSDSNWMREPKKSDLFHVAVFAISFLLSFIVILIMFVIYNTFKSCRQCSRSQLTQGSSSCYTCDLLESSLPSYEKCIQDDNKALPDYRQLTADYWQLEHNCYCTCVSDREGKIRSDGATCLPYSGATSQPFSGATCQPYSGATSSMQSQMEPQKINSRLTHIYPKEQKLLKNLEKIQIV